MADRGLGITWQLDRCVVTGRLNSMSQETLEAKTRDQKLLETVKSLADQTLRREVASLKRKFAKMEESRNDWREAANRYQKRIVELTDEQRRSPR